MSDLFLYFLAFILAFLISILSLPLVRKHLFNLLKDTPTELKNHKGIVPAVGGTVVALGFFISLIVIRFITDFPSGTLRNLRGIFIGAAMVYILGLIDDMKKPQGLTPYAKIAFQIAGALVLIYYGIYIQFLPQPWGYILTVLWVVGVTNAINLIDIMDGLAVSISILAALSFAVISLPSEFIYVNFAACALLGACLGFWPYNHSKKLKSFLGDSGSNMIGFLLAALALGTSYSKVNPLAVFVPLIILAVPIFDTLFVSAVRMAKGISPLKGTPDHYPLRLERLGLKRSTILLLSILVAFTYDALAYAITKTGTTAAIIIYLIILADLLFFAVFLKLKTK